MNKLIQTLFPSILILVVIVGGITTICIYRILEDIQNKPKTNIVPTSTHPTSGLSSLEILEDVSGWKILRNKDYGFEIKYPENWTFKDVTPSHLKKSIIAPRFYHLVFYDSEGNRILALYTPIWEIGFLGFKVIEKTKIPMTNSDKFFEKTVYYFPETKMYTILIQWNKDNFYKSGEISFSYKDESDPNLEILDEMLSSFRFIHTEESNNDQENWKIYQSHRWGFQIKAPKDWIVEENNRYYPPRITIKPPNEAYIDPISIDPVLWGIGLPIWWREDCDKDKTCRDLCSIKRNIIFGGVKAKECIKNNHIGYFRFIHIEEYQKVGWEEYNVIHFLLENEYKEYLPLYNKILNTFRFLIPLEEGNEKYKHYYE